MGETQLRLCGVRRFPDQTFTLTSPTILVGPNGAGKTTVIEAIYYASLGRSYRTASDRDLIGWETDTARIELVAPSGLTVTRAISTFGGILTKQVQVNGQKLTPVASLGHVAVVLFAPELIELMTGSPRVRRRYLDTLLSATDRQYAHALITYQHALKQRNALLMDQRSIETSFDIWERMLVDHGSVVLAAREHVIQTLITHAQPAYNELEAIASPRLIELSYESTVTDSARYEELLVASRERDRRGGGTSVGPHRDDMQCLLGGKPLSFASRGEQRSFLLALKHAELALYRRQEGALLPYLLLDDLFSELDQRRARHLVKLLAGYPTIVTTTDATLLDTSLRDQAAILELSYAESTLA